MSIRANQNQKDHLHESPVELTLVENNSKEPEGDALLFWTAHPTKKTLVDLRMLRDGQLAPKTPGGAIKWTGPFKGRPELVSEMLPALQDQLAPMAPHSVHQITNTLKSWWRALDSLEADAQGQPALTSTVQLSALHRQRAVERNVDRLAFNSFLLLANKTRVALGHRPLFWPRLEQKNTSRKLPPPWQTDMLRRELKHRWYSVLDRWALADSMRVGGGPLVSAQKDPALFAIQTRLLRNYRFLDEAIKESGHPRPGGLAGKHETLNSKQYYAQGYDQLEMLEGLYPSGGDVRAAFLLCLATTGWNPAVLLDLPVGTEFIHAHPKDPKRYILRGLKARGGVEQVSEGLFKSQASAATVLRTLMARTEPLRAQLRIELRKLESQFVEAGSADKNTIQKKIESLTEGVRSPWLYVTIKGEGIHWLTKRDNGSTEFLAGFINQLNSKRGPDEQLAVLKASDFRDAYAASVYHASGGSILAVMKALSHRRLASTQGYLENTLLKEEHRALYETFSAGLWHEIKVHRRVDPTLLAKWSRDGSVTDEERERLAGYRSLMRSRIGVGCKDPHNPPTHIAPSFNADGNSLCHVQRCLLCTEHAVIFPDSLLGICKRSAELQHIRQNMSVAAFMQTSFKEELDNTEIALVAFDAGSVAVHVADWTVRIASGTHRVIEFDGQSVVEAFA